MSSGYTYTPPEEEIYMRALLLTLKKRGYQQIIDCLENGHCSFYISSTYSRIRWDGLCTVVTFSLPLTNYERLDLSEEDKNNLISICNLVMPKETGLDVTGTEFSPNLDSLESAETLKNDLDKMREQIRTSTSKFTLPEDIIDKGKQMAEAYIYLYVVENYVRLFIERVAREKHGIDYFTKLNIPSSIRGFIAGRKTQEAKNQWISVRGDSDLFYLDFKELGTIIQNNWEIFKPYFPDQSWICSKIDELGNCRNLIAHNSIIGEHERDVIRVNFNSILRQLGHTLYS